MLEGSKSIAILLIHGFTGSPAEMRLLGEYLFQKGYTVYAPLLKGHGTTPEEMAKTSKDDWFHSVNEAYEFLYQKGYHSIVAIGLSMGGILVLKLSTMKKLIGVVSLAAPIFVRDKRIAWAKWLKYFKAYNKKVGKAPHIEQYLDSYDRTPIAAVEGLYQLMKEVKVELGKVELPILVLQGKKDETVDTESAQYIFDHISSTDKELLWYEKSSHIMTLDHEREQIFEDIHRFLEKIKV